MKWIRENYKGEKVVWYSADVIETIKAICTKVMIACDCKVISYKEACRGCENKTAREICANILNEIHNEDK